MSKFEMENNKVALWFIDEEEKVNPKEPDFRGNLKVGDTMYQISLWKNTIEEGKRTPHLSGNLSVKDAAGGSKKRVKKSDAFDF